MLLLTGLFLGLLSGLLISSAFISLFGASTSIAGFVLPIFLLGWAGSAWLMMNGTRSVSRVWSRGALIGAAEWMFMIFATWMLAGHSFGEVAKQNDSVAGRAGAGIGAGIFGVLGSGISLFMVFVCLVVWFIASRAEKEFKREEADVSDTKPVHPQSNNVDRAA